MYRRDTTSASGIYLSRWIRSYETLEAGEKVSLKITYVEEKVTETGKDGVTKPSTGNLLIFDLGANHWGS